MPDRQPIRVLLAKPGLDGHDRGARVVVRALREAGMDVVYTGIRQTPEAIATAAKRHNAGVIGLSILSGAHLTLFPRVLDALQSAGIDPGSVVLIAGGIIPDEDIPALREMGFQAVFGPGTHTSEMIAFIRNAARP
ncbi:MAG: methylmalonyl-CoA mutase [Dehalococcoidia bacterium]|nr:methylmalonyl-CoA mutase [Dehalococcoidia bacterium]